MGCDIHPVLEMRWVNPKTNETRWVGLHDFPSRMVQITLQPHLHPSLKLEGPLITSNWISYRAQDRNYKLFGLLANVRGHGEREPRGMPDDASYLARIRSQEMEGDGHSHSWVTAREWIEACWQCEEDHAKLFLNPEDDDPRRVNAYAHYLELDNVRDNPDPDSGCQSADDFRIVFWFDN